MTIQEIIDRLESVPVYSDEDFRGFGYLTRNGKRTPDAKAILVSLKTRASILAVLRAAKRREAAADKARS
ncbi:hypothetical protein ACWX0K_15115 [Nitrobacteraceae bacterium UC4446_H13]